MKDKIVKCPQCGTETEVSPWAYDLPALCIECNKEIEKPVKKKVLVAAPKPKCMCWLTPDLCMVHSKTTK